MTTVNLFKRILELRHNIYRLVISPEIAPAKEGYNSCWRIEILVAVRTQKADISIENSYFRGRSAELQYKRQRKAILIASSA